MAGALRASAIDARLLMQEMQDLSLSTIYLLRQIVYSPNGRQMATSSSDGTVYLWDLPSPF
jgi:WD40 repeat protein